MKSRIKRSRQYRFVLVLSLLAALSVLGYLSVSYLTFSLGFPLDDAWIHQTYARNLAVNGEWAFIPGQPSAGSTAPLWSGMLAIGYWLGLEPYVWVYGIGWSILATIGVLGGLTFRLLQPQHEIGAFFVGLFLIFEWHLVWAAVSGMETLLIALIILGVMTYLLKSSINWLVLGILIGLGAWVRPDGLTLIGPALLVLYFRCQNWKERLTAAMRLGLGTLSLFGPYLAFNFILSGTVWPNTFFAKQAEYSTLRQTPLAARYLAQAALPLIGAGAMLVPGFLITTLRAVRYKAWGVIAGVSWFLGYLFIYALRLPVIYQHGRYVIPAMPIYFVWALAGMTSWIDFSSTEVKKRILSRTWIVSTGLILVVFWFMGARAYGQDVAIIETEMVATAHWIADHTPDNALIAAHDIGALGYFGCHRLLDLAGLVSPEVIPFIRDEQRLAEFLDQNKVDFLVTFPSWYPYLSSQGELIHQSDGIFSVNQGGDNMSVYRWIIP
jgi:arabinofuranosyltransferase